MKIIFCDSHKKAQSALKDLRGRTFCIFLTRPDNYADSGAFIKSSGDFTCLDRDKLYSRHKEYFKKQYVECIARLNRNQHLFDWHALNFASKSRLSFDFYYRLFHIWIIDYLLDSLDADNLMVVFDERAIISQIRQLSRAKGHVLILKISYVWKKLFLTVFHSLPFMLMGAFMRTLLQCLLAKILLRPQTLRDKNYYVIKTMISAHSFDKGGKFYDIYFGKLLDHLKRKGIHFVVNANVFAPYFTNILKIVKNRNNIKIFTRQTYLSYSDVIRCFAVSFNRYWRMFDINEANLDNIDISLVVRSEIKRECAAKDYFLNSLEYYSIKSFSRNVKFERIIYPFEHKSWESMLVLGLRSIRKDVDIMGYQHTSIAPKYTNFLLGGNEARYAPLPDKIICMGRITKDIMRNYGNFPDEILQVGVALRQSIVDPGRWQGKRRNISNILVALTTDTREYVRMLNFLRQVFCGDCRFSVRIRPHPLMYIEQKIDISDYLPHNFHLDPESNLDDSLSWAGIVFYSSSTVSIESLQRGIPVIYIDFKQTLCPDPLFELSDFKWNVSESGELIPTLDNIQNMPEDAFERAKNNARKYASEYIWPAMDKELDVFLGSSAVSS